MENGKTRYHLITLKDSACKGEGVRYWAIDKGDRWANLVKNVWVAKEGYEVVETAEVEHITELDWAKTPLHDNTLASGWLSRGGKFYGCPSNSHDKFAECVLGMKVPELEGLGWVRIYDRNYFTCQHRMSVEQRNWLLENGYAIEDYH